jgi:hypothetical protein
MIGAAIPAPVVVIAFSLFIVSRLLLSRLSSR